MEDLGGIPTKADYAAALRSPLSACNKMPKVEMVDAPNPEVQRASAAIC